MSGWTTHSAAGLEYLERPGNGETLVLLHGIGSQAASFTPLLPHLPRSARVIAWSAPGYGESHPLDREWPEATDYAAALRRLFAALDIGRATLVGHSLGALMGAAFAARHGDLVCRLVMASPALGHGVVRGGGLSSAAQSRIDDLEHEGAAAFAAARAARLVHRAEDHPEAVEIVRDAMSRVKLPGYAQAARMLASGRLLDDAERLSVPTDVIVGAGDVVTPPDGARRAHAAVPARYRGAFTLVPEAGHAIYQQAPAAFATALEQETVPAK
ncbi:alpha/beta fold hydrolase [Maritimibacter sp. UBA3975]|uniref:alpha/beta fold hydrolase n=1 Tax=Maritimibacter sp. UBA3975 TaxID=1946833 RepID=UPI000C0B12B3|nr:alpha/beta fold hydrolase [Maritimibacter sp. UBA3975]MAM63184.1 alpha/beta hydrolase [Maritimibacter sp.]|tara:strand:+ start:19400 stop:20212 length:813 start_codon:yes stop_codon:yes gene_type:complete